MTSLTRLETPNFEPRRFGKRLLDEEAVPISAFVTSFGQFQWKYMPFGLRNAPGTLQCLVNRVLVGLDKYAAAYLDDILIFSNSWSEHILNIREVLKRIKRGFNN